MTTLAEVLARFPAVADRVETELAADGASAPSSDGLINQTWVLESVVVQRLHPIFDASVNQDIAALVPVLLRGGVGVPEILSADDGRPWIERAGSDERPEVWRVCTRLSGRTVHAVESPEMAASAGRALAAFHGATKDVAHRFAFTRGYVHDTPRHIATLWDSIARHPEHRLVDDVRQIAEAIGAHDAHLQVDESLPERVVHGDPKISNFLFGDDDASVVGVLDLDTMARAPIDGELGDAMRSWCNTGAEDEARPAFDEACYHAAVASYRAEAEGWLTPEELASIPSGVVRICLELAARFAADALNERYFGWDPARFATRGAHNVARARNQLGLGLAAAEALL